VRIIGISLVKDEERYVDRALRNALALCDEIFVLDNESDDGTPEVLAMLTTEFPGRIHARHVHNLLATHDVVQPFVGAYAWVFGVDGDEVYDPVGLAKLRAEILSGRYQDAWMIRANFLHCCELRGDTAVGWLAPPSKDPSKLYNFSRLEAWPVTNRALFLGVDDVRLTGGERYWARQHTLNQEHDWHESHYRCLHLKFVRRSSVDVHDPLSHPRQNNDDVTYLAAKGQGMNRRACYRRGPLATVDSAPFLHPELIA